METLRVDVALAERLFLQALLWLRRYSSAICPTAMVEYPYVFHARIESAAEHYVWASPAEAEEVHILRETAVPPANDGLADRWFRPRHRRRRCVGNFPQGTDAEPPA
ncbi:uncharacterized protein LOC124777977 [Schistocerca piceifrons]|uniref:uncharacterized protein LOC124777977 n=1 Tax=Schistocerca piceifrons TaxID=274613 RepID=UPI001F5F1121|nr:uncharacterized protein LOC124777977 [Schistocerca piceifrons]